MWLHRPTKTPAVQPAICEYDPKREIMGNPDIKLQRPPVMNTEHIDSLGDYIMIQKMLINHEDSVLILNHQNLARVALRFQ